MVNMVIGGKWETIFIPACAYVRTRWLPVGRLLHHLRRTSLIPLTFSDVRTDLSVFQPKPPSSSCYS